MKFMINRMSLSQLKGEIENTKVLLVELEEELKQREQNN